MNQIHPFTNVAAIAILAGVLVFGGINSTPSRIEFTSSSAPVDVPLVVETQQANEVQEIAAENKVSGVLSTNLKKVFAVGREVGNPETLQAILLQETRGGAITQRIGNKNAPVGKRSYGVMQVQVVAARSVLQRVPKVFERYFPGRKYQQVADEEIIALLLTNDEANIRIAAHHLKIYMKLAGGNWAKAVMGYNAGIGTAMKVDNHEEFSYVVEIKEKLADVVKPFNVKHGLRLTRQSDPSNMNIQ